MMSHISCRSFQTSVAIVFLVACGSIRSAEASRPNVILIYVDDVGAVDWQFDEALNPSGSHIYETPNLLGLARTGITYKNAYAPSPVCSSSRASVLTGQTPARNRMTDWFEGSPASGGNVRRPHGWLQNLPADQITLAESLLGAGYRTDFVGKWHLAKAPFLPGADLAAADPLRHGFETNVAGSWIGSLTYQQGSFFAGEDGAWAGLPHLDTVGEFAHDAYLPEVLTDHATQRIATHAANQEPFFLMFSPYLAHVPIEAPATLTQKYEQKIEAARLAGQPLNGHTDPAYAAMIESLDESIGKLLSRLSDPNADGNNEDSIRDETLIVFTSDNGGLINDGVTSNGELRSGKGSIYEGGIRVPMIVSAPVDATTNSTFDAVGIAIDEPVAGYDIVPTILELAELPHQPTQVLDGMSLTSTFGGQSLDREFLVWHYPHVSPQTTEGSFASAIRSDDWKLIWLYDEERYELYDLEGDPGESTNLRDEHPEIVGRLSLMLHAELLRFDAQMPMDLSSGLPVSLPPVVPVLAAEPQLTMPAAILLLLVVMKGRRGRESSKR